MIRDVSKSGPDKRLTAFRILAVAILFSFPLRPTSQALAQGEDSKRPWDPNAVRLETRALAPGVYAVLPDDADHKDHVATTGGFVVGTRGILVIESMLNAKLAAQLRAQIHRYTKKPLRFLVNTSHHGDHSYGNSTFPRSVLVIQHPRTRDYIREKFEQDRAFMLQLMGRGRGIESVRPRAADLIVPDRLTLDLGGVTAEILHLGFGQTPGDLIVWLPNEKIAWVGNMVQAGPPALPWLLEGRHRETLATLQRLRAHLPEDATIIPGHGRPISRRDLAHSVTYLEQLDREVRRAIREGLSLEQTVERAKMPQYEGYSLYAFAHSQVNVPAVYRDLSASSGAR